MKQHRFGDMKKGISFWFFNKSTSNKNSLKYYKKKNTAREILRKKLRRLVLCTSKSTLVSDPQHTQALVIPVRKLVSVPQHPRIVSLPDDGRWDQPPSSASRDYRTGETVVPLARQLACQGGGPRYWRARWAGATPTDNRRHAMTSPDGRGKPPADNRRQGATLADTR